MGESTGIVWTDATVNFWWGCTKVGPGCDFCYAETWDKRLGGDHWGVGAPRRKIKSAVQLMKQLDNEYAAWAADATVAVDNARAFGLPVPIVSHRRRVFVQSMADLFDNEAPLDWFIEGWRTIEACNRIDVQIVTKRISVVKKRLAEIGVTAWPQHAGLIITIVDQAEAERDIPRLIALKKELGIPWVGISTEPLLGPLDLTPWLADVDWVIAGGESGAKARPPHPVWFRALRDQCAAAGVAFLFKQWGEWAPHSLLAGGDLGGDVRKGRVRIVHPTGEDDVQVSERTGGRSTIPGSTYMARIGTKKSGNQLDGRQHLEFPR